MTNWVTTMNVRHIVVVTITRHPASYRRQEDRRADAHDVIVNGLGGVRRGALPTRDLRVKVQGKAWACPLFSILSGAHFCVNVRLVRPHFTCQPSK